MKKLAIGIDVGGTNVTGGLINQTGQVLKSVTIPYRVKVLDQDLCNLILALKTSSVIGVGIGAPGVGKKFNKKLAKTDTLNILNRLNNNRPGLAKKIKLPIALENDANCFTLGEALFGAGKKHRTIIGITLGTGVGFGLTIDQKIYHGRGSMTEFGHMMINYDDKIYCQCRNQGCWEGYIGKKGIIRLAIKNRLKIHEPKDLYYLAQNHNQSAKKSWQEFGTILGVGLANLMNGLSPDIVVVGGRVARAWKLFYKLMQQEVQRRTLITPCPIIKSRQKNAAVLGAGSILLKPN